MTTRFRIEPLAVLTNTRSASELATVAGVSRRTVVRWRSQGLSSQQADRAATAAGYHPLNVWTDWR